MRHSQDRLSADLELQALGKCSNCGEHPGGVRQARLQEANDLHARRTHGSIASCGKTRSWRKCIAPARNWPRNATTTSKRSSQASASANRFGNGSSQWLKMIGAATLLLPNP